VNMKVKNMTDEEWSEAYQKTPEYKERQEMGGIWLYLGFGFVCFVYIVGRLSGMGCAL